MITLNAEPETTIGEEILSIGQVKRVLEWWSSSEAFRDLIAVDPAEAGRRYDIGFDPELIRPLWDPFHAQAVARTGQPVHPAVDAYRAFYCGKTQWRSEIKAECSPDEPRFKAWRLRQIARNTMENGGYDESIIHTPMAIEITDGCSVNCWFCGVGATKMAESWRYTPDNATLWREVLTVLRGKIGKAARWGFCYWATDPLDNPDYEDFASDFAAIVGMFPQTTTAQGHKDPERIRAILRLSEARGCRVNRFSVLTEPLLRQIYATYTPDELTNVEIVAQMRGATVPKAAAGAFRELAKTNKKVVDLEQRKLGELADRARRLAGDTGAGTAGLAMAQPGTIACVSGFLLNIIKRSIKLISPCRANEKWPLGYIVFDERTFRDAADLERHLESMMAEHMPLMIAPQDRMRLHPGFTCERVPDGFQVLSEMGSLAFIRRDMGPYIESVGEQLGHGHKTAAQIAFSAFFQHGVPEANTLGTLGQLFERGLLVDAKGRVAGERASAA